MDNKLQKTSPITWKDGVPTSGIYGDIYFSTENGLQETIHTFLDGNKLEQRWGELQDDFHIAETGFGTGLNFFASWKLWREKNRGTKLYYTSIEKHPLCLTDIQKSIGIWPEFQSYLDEFSAQYPSEPADKNELILDEGMLHLTLLWGDVNNALPFVSKPVDAWFLDGFSPAKNPDMWSNNLYQHMARLTKQDGTFATFTASGEVRRGLQQKGFKVDKVPGFGRKRHMLVGYRLCL